MQGQTALFACTTPWLYKAYNLALIISTSSDTQLFYSLLCSFAVAMGGLLLVCVLPSMVHPVRSRVATNSLVLQALLMLTGLQAGLSALVSHGHANAAALWTQLVGGHIAYSVAAATLADKTLLVGAPFVAVAFGCAAAALPLAASLAGPRAPEAHGIFLVAALGAGEVCGILAFCVAQALRMGGHMYEAVVRGICE